MQCLNQIIVLFYLFLTHNVQKVELIYSIYPRYHIVHKLVYNVEHYHLTKSLSSKATQNLLQHIMNYLVLCSILL